MKTNPQSDHKGNILLVDDNPDNLQLLSELLIQLGYSVRSVTSGRMALKTVRVKQPDLILLDVKMPDMDGYEVCRAMKAYEDSRHIPVIFISALNDVFDKITAFQSGGIDYITKPFQVEEVVARMENQLTIQRQQRLLEKEVAKRRETEEVLYQSRALLASILNSSLDGIAAMQSVRDPETGDIEDFRCLVVNPVISRALEKNREEMIGKLMLKNFLHRLQPELFARFVEVVEMGEAIEQDFCYELQGLRWYHFVAVKLGDGFAITIRDITGRKQTELALQSANKKLEELANLDGLTQVANRRCFNTHLLEQWKNMLEAEHPLSIVIFDIDSFKYYNDYYGHLAGDDCLFKLAQGVQQAVCPAHLLARYGGEEFIVLLSDTDLAGAVSVSKNIQQAIHALAIPHLKSDVKKIITVSLGIASTIPKAEMTPETLIRQADEALYQAKEQGRDRYCIWS